MKEKPDAYLTRHFAGDGGQCIDGDAGVIQAFANKYRGIVHVFVLEAGDARRPETGASWRLYTVPPQQCRTQRKLAPLAVTAQGFHSLTKVRPASPGRGLLFAAQGTAQPRVSVLSFEVSQEERDEKKKALKAVRSSPNVQIAEQQQARRAQMRGKNTVASQQTQAACSSRAPDGSSKRPRHGR